MKFSRIAMRLFSLCLAILWCLPVSLPAQENTGSAPAPVENIDLASVTRRITSERLQKHIQALAAVDSRVPGYPGHDRALEYLRSEFESYGYDDIRIDAFPVTIPVDEGASLEIVGTGKRFTLHALWPNLVRTSQLPAKGLTAKAVDGGNGDWKNLNGQTVEDNVVFIDFNSGRDWLNSAMLGAAAIVFVEPDNTVCREAEAKLATVPLSISRFWISKADYNEFAATGLGAEIRLRARMPWREVEGKNLLVRLKGTAPESERKLVCIEAYYDSMSVVPSVAPGAESACGVAAMLEIARTLKDNPPASDVLFLATSAHFMRNMGITAFMHQHARRRSPFDEQTKQPILPDLMLCLDLSSQNETLGVTFKDSEANASLAKAQYLYTREFLRHANLFCDYADRLSPVLGREPEDLCLNLVIPEQGGSWRAFLPENILLDSVTALVGATPAVSLVTIHDPRMSADTPLDRPSGVNIDNLTMQTRFLAGAFLIGLSDPNLLAEPKMEEDRLRVFKGRLVTFDPKKSFMPDEPVRGGIGRLRTGGINKAGTPPSALGVRRIRLGLTDTNGVFVAYTSVAGGYGIEGYELHPDTGEITKALDLGLEGASQYPPEFTFDTYSKERNCVLFKCSSTDFYDIVDPRYLIAMNKLLLFDPGNAEPFAFGYCLNSYALKTRTSEAEPYATVFAKSGVPIKVGVSSDVLGQRMLFLNSPSAKNKKESEGEGYRIGQLRVVASSPFQALRDMFYLDEFRMNTLRRFGIKNRRLERLHGESAAALKDAKDAAGKKQWDRFIRKARQGLGVESRAYPDVRATADDVVKGIVFYMALLLPFAFFCERLFFGFPTLKKQVLALVGFFIASYIVLRLVHPAFKIVETSEVILLGLVILALCGIVVSISATRFEAQMRSLKQQRGKVHYTDVSRASATATAFALGVSNMRRRKVRTFLTCLAVVLLMFTVLSFTSVKTFLRPRKVPRPNAPSYQGALIRDRTWVPMKFLALEHLRNELRDTAILARRSWLAPQEVSEDFTQLSLLVRPMTEDGMMGREHIRCFGLVGFDALEPEVSGLASTLKAGRWFEEGERDVCVLPDSVAEALNIGPDDVGTQRVHLYGMDLTVVGIVDAEKYDAFRDLDNERMTPLDFTMLSRQALTRASKAGQDVSQIEGRAPLETFVHVDARNVVLMPYETVLDAGGALESVAVKFPEGSISERIEHLLDRLAVTVFVGEGDRVMVYSSLASSSFGGMGNILVPVLIAALMVLNTMSGSVHERLKEIGTYSSVGLAPSHIGALFLAEACVYAILGGIAGYVIGQVLTKILLAFGGLAGLTLNYSSLASVMASVVVMLTVVLSTLYPARMASRLAVPDVTRKWKLPDPDGDQWHFDFPFTVGGSEVAGLYVFFRYYFASFEEQSVGRFYTSETTLSSSQEADRKAYQLSMRVWLAPYDLGISQDVELRAVPTGDFGVYAIELRIDRLSGQQSTWVRINRGFLDEIRKQFLLWRTLTPEMKQEYGEEAHEAFA